MENNNTDSRSNAIRQAVGERLKDFREGLNLSVWKIAKKSGLRVDQVQYIESGDKNYTIDSFFAYITGCDLYIYFAEKNKKVEPHDFADMIAKGDANYPEK